LNPNSGKIFLDFSPVPCAHNVPGLNQPNIYKGYGGGGIYPGVKQPRREDDRSPPCNSEVKSEFYGTLIAISGKY